VALQSGYSLLSCKQQTKVSQSAEKVVASKPKTALALRRAYSLECALAE